MFGSKMTKKDMQANIKAMLAKTKISDSTTQTTSAVSSSQPFKKQRHFEPKKEKPNP